jgi:NAD(P)-dependent dehydrogenase (short-subunit alcohol dehydrogenase family)
MSALTGRTTFVVGASRGLGRGIARAFAETGAPAPLATRAPSRAAARRARRAAGSDAPLRRSIYRGCEATATPKPIARP